MKKYIFAVLLLAGFQMVTGQNNQLWKGYFSFNEIKDVSQSPTTVYAAAENAIFSENITTHTLKTTTTIDGLSGQTITALYHSDALNKTMIGYDNGLIIVINEADGTILNVVDIINKQLPSNIKRVNHFMESGGIVYVSCDFGIVQYNLATLLFGDTYFIGDNGNEIVVSQTAVFNGDIYAATSNGIRRALITNPNLIDFSQWTQVVGGVWSGVETFGTELTATSAGQLSRYNGSSFTQISALPLPIVDLRASGNYLLVTTSDRVYLYNQSLSNVTQVNSDLISNFNAVFTCATAIGDNLYIGTVENGIITTTVT
ncbi:MAG: ABC transporter substrate-binding protein, partial [Flavobacterium sp.]